MIWLDLVILKFCFWKVYFFSDAKTSWWWNLLSPTQISQGLKCLVGYRQSFSHDRAWKKRGNESPVLLRGWRGPAGSQSWQRGKAKKEVSGGCFCFNLPELHYQRQVYHRFLDLFPWGRTGLQGGEKALASLLTAASAEGSRDTKRCHRGYFSFTEVSKFEHLKEKYSRWIFYWIINEL